jgi:hypothetical protein
VKTWAALAALLLALAVAGSAAGKERRARGKVCGASGCAVFTGASLSFGGSNFFYRHLAPAPYFVVTITLPPNVLIPWPSEPMIYVPSKGRWRVTMYGASAWYDVPDVDVAVLKRTLRGLRPFPAPRRWR